MHWPRFYSVLERCRGNQKLLQVITISYAFPLLFSVAGGHLQNNKYCTLQAVFLPVTTVCFRELFTDRNLQNWDSLVPCHTSLIEGERQDHQSTAVAPFHSRIPLCKKNVSACLNLPGCLLAWKSGMEYRNFWI